MHGARLLVDRLVHAHAVEQRIERRLRQRRAGGQADLVDLVHQVAEHRALAAAGRRRALLRLRFEVGEAAAGRDGDRIDVPVDLHRHDVVDAVDEPLIAQPADRERFRCGAQRHQREELLLVDVERERMLAGDRRRARGAGLVDRVDGERRRARGVGQQRPVGSVGGVCRLPPRRRFAPLPPMGASTLGRPGGAHRFFAPVATRSHAISGSRSRKYREIVRARSRGGRRATSTSTTAK